MDGRAAGRARAANAGFQRKEMRVFQIGLSTRIVMIALQQIEVQPRNPNPKETTKHPVMSLFPLRVNWTAKRGIGKTDARSGMEGWPAL